MKTIISIALICTAIAVHGQKTEDVRVFKIDASNLELFALHNMNGKVTVKGIEGNNAVVRVTRKLRSSSSSWLEKSTKSIYFDTVRVDNKIYFFMQHPELQFKIDVDGKGRYRSYNDYGNWNDKDKHSYDFTIEVEVPKTVKSQFSTHRKDLIISNIQSDLIAWNHHDNLFVADAGGNVSLHTHHGDIKTSFTKNPSDNCDYSTHHGDISIDFKENLKADIKLKTKHGNFYTAFDYQSIPLKMSKSNGGKGTKYVLGGSTGVRIGSGGPLHDFHTYHGSVYLNKVN